MGQHGCIKHADDVVKPSVQSYALSVDMSLVEITASLFWWLLLLDISSFVPISSIINNPHPSTTIKCPLTRESSCAVNVTPVETHTGLTVGQCYSACNQLSGCSWFNFITSSYNPERIGECRLIDKEPTLVTLVSRCNYFQVLSLEYFEFFKVTLATNSIQPLWEGRPHWKV